MLLFLIGCLQIDETQWTDWLENDLPQISEPVISPNETIYNDTELTCSATATDVEDGALDVSYIWEKDGDQIGQEATISLGSLQISPGETISCVVSAQDLAGAEVSDSASVVIENRAPVIETLSLTNDSPQANEEINCLVTASDPDGGEPTKAYQWKVGGVLVSTDSSVTLSPDLAFVGQTAECFVSVEDEHGGEVSSSVSGIIQNTAPIVSNVMITPNTNVNANSELTCSATIGDLNEGGLIPEYRWTNGALEIGTEETIQLSWSVATMGDDIQCAVTATDEHGASDQGLATVTLGNAMPAVQSPASISSSTGYIVGAEATCLATFTDVEDGFLNSVYVWDVNGNVVGAGASYIITAEDTNINDVLRCTATGTDSQGETATSQTSVLIDNTPPVIEEITITPSPFYNDSTITCTAVVSDPDEAPTYTVAWFASIPGGGWITHGSTNPLELSSLGSLAPYPEDEIRCEVTAQDLQGETDFDSQTVSVGNRAPSIPSVAFSWTPSGGNNPGAVETSDVTCIGGGSTDADGDTVTYSYLWTSSTGNSVSGAILFSTDTSEGDVWSCTVSASDGGLSSQSTSAITITPTISWEYCDGSLSMADGQNQLIGENSEDKAGQDLSIIGDVDGDGLDDLLIGAPENNDGGNNAGKAYLILGSSIGVSGTIDLSTADYSFTGEGAGDLFGHSVASAGDVDGDGLDDILIGAKANGHGGSNAGKVYLFLGGSLGNTTELSASNADYSFTGEDANNYAGVSVSSAGDVDNDGLDDILIGAYMNSQYSASAGKAYLILGSSLGLEANISLDVADYFFLGSSVNDFLGFSVASAGDVDNDGYDDILIGAHGFDEGGTEAGAVGLFLGASFGQVITTFTMATADYLFVGEEPYNLAGISTASAGDVDGDGLDDILIGAYGYSGYRGKTYVILGSSLDLTSMIDLANADYSLLGETADSYSGTEVSSAGDVDGDGLDDVLIGAYGYGNSLGQTYLFFSSSLGGSSGNLSTADHIFSGDDTDDKSGQAVSGGGDLNGDGVLDILISSSSNDSNGIDAGKASLFLGCE